ncbi:MAG: diadenylate cyclase CdaA [Anaerolineaceae bacterium]|nr:diadenylate cyclase CdaA [Anaerolineaceae bacterium]
MDDLILEIVFLVQRVNWLTLVDLFLVSMIFYIILMLLKDTQAQTLTRGVIFVVILISLLTTLVNLPAFSWLVSVTLPALLFSIPVLFMPEIRRGLERLGRAGSGALFIERPFTDIEVIQKTIKDVVAACARLAVFRQGALIVLQRRDNLREYEATGVQLGARVTPELLLQIFHPNTPLHDGAVIINKGLVSAGACVMPLSSSGVLNSSPERQMGLRHRAALGISEVSDAIAVVVSEETGSISLAHRGRLMRRISADKLENVLLAFFKQQAIADDRANIKTWFQRLADIFREPKD